MSSIVAGVLSVMRPLASCFSERKGSKLSTGARRRRGQEKMGNEMVKEEALQIIGMF
ncbi:hypothetical protein SAY86_021816 [Trapa natans]|uniref:Uncharacterized protein n=1 Tax=Trapa natans TaxID=22666 RepID=A0AAN7MAD8_TRANT|nr:hypothetical protein SAY86_021816 [Trapa natans]